MTSGPLIYDVGMNNGDDTAFYLACGYRVIAIEANPRLCAHASVRFTDAIANGSLRILNIGVGGASGELDFFIPEGDEGDLRGSFAPIGDRSLWRALERPIPVMPLSALIATHGLPYYAKIDVEGLDGAVLDDLHAHQIMPAYLSAEAHDPSIIEKLAAMGYQNFKITNCDRVSSDYANAIVSHADGSGLLYHFPPHSSGPFGPDLFGPWMSRAAIALLFEARHLLWGPLCWVDIHAALIV